MGLAFFCFRLMVSNQNDLLGTPCILFSALITAVITDSIKVAVGRPRPSFFWWCFPDSKAVFNAITKDVVCHRDKKVIREGYKSFPSGHTSWMTVSSICYLLVFPFPHQAGGWRRMS